MLQRISQSPKFLTFPHTEIPYHTFRWEPVLIMLYFSFWRIIRSHPRATPALG